MTAGLVSSQFYLYALIRDALCVSLIDLVLRITRDVLLTLYRLFASAAARARASRSTRTRALKVCLSKSVTLYVVVPLIFYQVRA